MIKVVPICAFFFISRTLKHSSKQLTKATHQSNSPKHSSKHHSFRVLASSYQKIFHKSNMKIFTSIAVAASLLGAVFASPVPGVEGIAANMTVANDQAANFFIDVGVSLRRCKETTGMDLNYHRVDRGCTTLHGGCVMVGSEVTFDFYDQPACHGDGRRFIVKYSDREPHHRYWRWNENQGPNPKQMTRDGFKDIKFESFQII